MIIAREDLQTVGASRYDVAPNLAACPNLRLAATAGSRAHPPIHRHVVIRFLASLFEQLVMHQDHIGLALTNPIVVVAATPSWFVSLQARRHLSELTRIPRPRKSRRLKGLSFSCVSSFLKALKTAEVTASLFQRTSKLIVKVLICARGQRQV